MLAIFSNIFSFVKFAPVKFYVFFFGFSLVWTSFLNFLEHNRMAVSLLNITFLGLFCRLQTPLTFDLSKPAENYRL